EDVAVLHPLPAGLRGRLVPQHLRVIVVLRDGGLRHREQRARCDETKHQNTSLVASAFRRTSVRPAEAGRCSEGVYTRSGGCIGGPDDDTIRPANGATAVDHDGASIETTATGGASTFAAMVEPGVVGWLICVAQDVVWWQGAAIAGCRAARAASHDTAHASSAIGWHRYASAKAARSVTRAMRDIDSLYPLPPKCPCWAPSRRWPTSPGASSSMSRCTDIPSSSRCTSGRCACSSASRSCSISGSPG